MVTQRVWVSRQKWRFSPALLLGHGSRGDRTKAFPRQETNPSLLHEGDWLLQESLVSLPWMDIEERNLGHFSAHPLCLGGEPFLSSFCTLHAVEIFTD